MAVGARSLLLTAMNLRGVRESGTAFAVPAYCFMLVDHRHGASSASSGRSPATSRRPTSAGLDRSSRSRATPGDRRHRPVFLLLRAFSSGCAALTGVEAISNGVPAFKKPKSKNAATTLLLMGAIAVTMLVVDHHARPAGPGQDRRRPARPSSPATASRSATTYVQQTVIGQLAEAVFDDFPLGVVFVSIATGLILVLAANTAFNGFPVLGSILARDGFLPRQLHTRGDRLAFSNGILILAGAAIVLVIVFNAEVTRLIQLYIVGVFVSFTTEPDRHGAALDPATCTLERDRQGARPDAALPGHQRDRRRRCPAPCCVVVLLTKFQPRREATPSSRWPCSSC